MQKAKPTCTKEFKLEAVHLWQTSEKSQSQIAHDLGIPDSTLSHWCLRFAEHGKDAFPGSGHLPPLEEENRQLKREVDLLRQERDVLKKSYQHPFAQPHIKYEFIAEQRHHYSVQLLCEALDVSESGYYAWNQHEPSAHEREDARIAALIQQIDQDHRHVHGSPRIHAKLRDYGVHCGRKRVVRLMQALGITALPKRSRKPTTKSDPQARFAPNLLNRDFSAEQPNTRWVTDTKAVETAEGWLYVAVMLDLYSRQVVGWAMSAREDGELVELALRMAVARRHPEVGLLHHSDRGTEFTCERYQAALHELGVEVSMSRTGNCWDNAAMEAFFATLACQSNCLRTGICLRNVLVVHKP